MYKNRFNHSPFVYGVWVEYNGWRFKNPYLIRTKDGKELMGVPNGGAWATEYDSWVEDADVTHIQVLKDNDPRAPRRGFSGGWRLARDIDYFGSRYPIWCGDEHGFVWPSELKPGQSIIPVSVVAHRNKKAPGKITLIVTKGIITAAKSDHGLGWAVQAIKYPGFWLDGDSEIMNNQEVIHGLHQVAKYEKLYYENPGLVAEYNNLLKSQGVPVHQQLYGFADFVNKYSNDRENFIRQFELHYPFADRLNPIESRFSRKKTAAEEKRVVMLNGLRGPLDTTVYSADMLSLSNFFANPTELPGYLKLIEE